jgi:hypothetical protein
VPRSNRTGGFKPNAFIEPVGYAKVHVLEIDPQHVDQPRPGRLVLRFVPASKSQVLDSATDSGKLLVAELWAAQPG